MARHNVSFYRPPPATHPASAGRLPRESAEIYNQIPGKRFATSTPKSPPAPSKQDPWNKQSCRPVPLPRRSENIASSPALSVAWPVPEQHLSLRLQPVFSPRRECPRASAIPSPEYSQSRPEAAPAARGDHYFVPPNRS